MKRIYKVLILLSMAGFLSQCAQDGDYVHPINHDNIPVVPILFSNAATVGGNPYVVTAWGTTSGGAVTPDPGPTTNIDLVISVAADSPTKIREITKMIGGATSVTPGILQTRANYLAAPVAVNGTTVTISTNLNAYNTKPTTVVPAGERVTAANINALTAAAPYTERAFMFLVTLEDGSTAVTQQFRLRITK